MTELEILERALSYLKNLSEGVDPITGEIFEESCSIRSERMVKFFCYLEGIVNDRIEYETRKMNKIKLPYNTEDYKGFLIVKKPIPFTPLRRLIKQNDTYHFVTGRKLRELLLKEGYITKDEETNYYFNTELGAANGILTSDNEHKFGNRGVLYYTEQFQKIIIDKIIDRYPIPSVTEKPVEPNNHINAGAAWTQQEESNLIREFSQGIDIKEISRLHERTSGAIRARLIKLGLIDGEK